MSLTKRLKILIYSLEDLASFTLAKCLDNPLFRVFIFFACVAPAYTMTQWHNISMYCAGAIRIIKGYPMIHRKGMPESGRSTAYGATTIEVVQGVLPVSGGESIGQRTFAGFASLIVCSYCSLIGKSPALVTLFSDIWPLSSKSSFVEFVPLSYLFTMRGAIFVKIRPHFIGVFLPPLFVIFSISLGVFFPIKFVLDLEDVLIVFVVSFAASLESIWVTLLPFLFVQTLTHLAAILQTVGSGFVTPEVFRRGGKFLLATRTAFYGGIHSAFLSLCSEDVIGRWRNVHFSGATLADGLIIPQFEGVNP